MKEDTDLKAVYIRWIDSSSMIGDGIWTDRDQINPDNLKPEICETIGWLMHETEDFVTIASSVCKNQVHGHMCIPKVAIVERRD